MVYDPPRGRQALNAKFCQQVLGAPICRLVGNETEVVVISANLHRGHEHIITLPRARHICIINGPSCRDPRVQRPLPQHPTLPDIGCAMTGWASIDQRRVIISAGCGPRPRGRLRGGPVGVRRYKDWVNSPPVAGWQLVIFSVFLGVAALVTFVDATALHRQGRIAEAKVLEVHDGRSSYVVVEFATTSGERIVADVDDYYWQPKPMTGDRQTILYDPDDPAGNVVDTRLGPDFGGSWLLAGFGVLSAALAWASFTRRIDLRKFA